MDISLGHIVGTIIGGLCVAGLIALVKKRRLYLYIPKLFPHSSLSDLGGTIELNLANKGFFSEEAIQISLRPRLRYQLVATTLNSISLVDNVINVPRLAPGQEVSVILLVEGGEFSPAEIAAATSKEAVVKIIKDPAVSQITPVAVAQTLGALALLMLLPAYLASMFTEVFGRNVFHVLYDQFDPARVRQRAALEKEGWAELSRFFAPGGLYQSYSQGRFPVENLKVSRKGDYLEITADIVNLTPNFLDVTVSAVYTRDKATSTPKTKNYWEGIVASKESSKMLIIAYFPVKESAQNLVLKIYLHGGNEWATLLRTIGPE